MENQATTSETSKTRQVSKAELTSMIESGSKKEQIATYYGLNMAQTSKLLKIANLKIRKFHTPSFTLVD